MNTLSLFCIGLLRSHFFSFVYYKGLKNACVILFEIYCVLTQFFLLTLEVFKDFIRQIVFIRLLPLFVRVNHDHHDRWSKVASCKTRGLRRYSLKFNCQMVHFIAKQFRLKFKK